MGQRLLVAGRARDRIAQPVEDGVAFPVAGFGDVVGLAEDLRLGVAQHLDDLAPGPDVELAFLAFGVGIERGGETAALGDHLAQHPLRGLVDAARVELVAALAVDLAHQVDEQRVVVEHLLEVRHQPVRVDRVAREAAAEMIVDAALADVDERGLHGVARRLVAVADGAAPEQPEEIPLRKFRRAGQAAVQAVDGADHAAGEIGQHGVVDVGGVPEACALLERVDQQAGVVGDLVGLLAVDAGDLAQHVGEAGAAVAGRRREIGAAPERARLAVEEHGERPAALLAEGVQRAHVDGVDVGALLAVDLDVHEQLVHDRGDVGVLEALVGHDVAPVAGGVADREQDRLVGGLGFGQCLRSPGPPVHRVVLVLQEVGAGLAAEAVLGVGVLGHAVVYLAMRARKRERLGTR